MLKQQLKDELKQSMLAKDAVKTSVLRMALSAVSYYEINKALGYEATDEDVLTVIQKEVKQHRDSIEQFKTGARQDLVDKETTELEILQKYLPAQMNEEEIHSLVVKAIKQTSASSPADMGKVMSALIPQVKGKADGGLVSKIVKEELAK